jgi:hypothetical protein
LAQACDYKFVPSEASPCSQVCDGGTYTLDGMCYEVSSGTNVTVNNA